MKWLKLDHGFSTSPKWRLVARRADAGLCEVIAVATHFLCDAARNDGNVTCGNDETDVTVGVSSDRVAAIRAAMHEGENPVLVAGRFANWDEHQDKTASKAASSTERVQRHRAKKNNNNNDKGGGEGGETPCNVSCVTRNDETPVTHETPLEERRIEKKDSDSPLRSESGDVEPSPSEPPPDRQIDLVEYAAERGALVPVGPSAQAQPEPEDLRGKIFARGVGMLSADGKRGDRTARSLIGRWLRDHGDGPVFDAISRAEREKPIDPKAWIMAALNRSRDGPRRRQQDEDPHAVVSKRLDQEFANDLDRDETPENQRLAAWPALADASA